MTGGPARNAVRGAVGALAIAILSLIVNVRQESGERAVSRPGAGISGQDDITLYTSRFESLRRRLPAGGVVGYLGYDGQEAQDTAMYYLAQYALAPVVVDRSDHHSLVVGNFPGPVPPAVRFLSPGLTLQGDFGNGVLLFGRGGG